MNDRFKFRVWNPNINMYDDDRSDVFVLLNQDRYMCLRAYNNKIIEQCTGLSDKNGNLIYEGDIVSGRYFNPHHPKTPNPKIKGTIKFIQDRMTWIIEDGDCGYDLEDCMPTKEYFEIIGNIHTGIKGE